MSMGSAAAAAIGGRWDVFDQVTGIMDNLMNRLDLLDGEDANRLFDYSMSNGKFEVTGGPDELMVALVRAQGAFEEILTLCQQAEAALPE